MKNKANEAYLSEAAEILGVSISAMWQAVKNNNIESWKKRGDVLHRWVDLEECEAYFSRDRKAITNMALEMWENDHKVPSIAMELGIKEASVKALINRAGYSLKGGRLKRD